MPRGRGRPRLYASAELGNRTRVARYRARQRTQASQVESSQTDHFRSIFLEHDPRAVPIQTSRDSDPEWSMMDDLREALEIPPSERVIEPRVSTPHIEEELGDSLETSGHMNDDIMGPASIFSTLYAPKADRR